MTTWKTLKVSVGDHIAKVVMNRPETRNAMSQEMAEELALCLQELAALPGLRVLILTGEGSAFGSGADLKESAPMTAAQRGYHRVRVLRCVDLLENFQTPVLAMVNGPAMAGGFELALACDIRVAAENAFFALTEVKNVGSFPGGGGPLRLPRLVGKGKAKYIVFTGRRFSAREAQELGFVEVVVPKDRLEKETYAIADEIAANSPLGIRAVKQVLNQSTEVHIQAATLFSQALRNPLDATQDYREGLNAWLEKRVPHFTGE